MTLELSPELETQIERAAQQHGMNGPAFAAETLRRAMEKQNVEAERRAAIARLRGCMKNSKTTVDDFLAERSAEGRREANK